MGVNSDHRRRRRTATAVGIVVLAAHTVAAADHGQEILEWRRDRLEELVADDGWLSVVGLHWLEEGETTFGTDPSADAVFPPAASGAVDKPRFLGTFSVTAGRAIIRPGPGGRIMVGGVPIGETPLITDQYEGTTILDSPPYRFYIIERQGRLGLRVKDLSRPATLPAPEIDHFPIRSAWRVEARFEPYDPPKKVPIPTVLGTINESISPGAVVFEVGGEEVRLDPILSGDRLFLIFTDGTTGRETYGGGRYLYTSLADSAGRIVVDFNKAHNPPCVFTDFGTCFLPPRQNRLPQRLEAGEKMVEGYTRH